MISKILNVPLTVEELSKRSDDYGNTLYLQPIKIPSISTYPRNIIKVDEIGGLWKLAIKNGAWNEKVYLREDQISLSSTEGVTEMIEKDIGVSDELSINQETIICEVCSTAEYVRAIEYRIFHMRI